MNVRMSLLEVFTYLNATPASRNVREGENLVNAGHLLICGITEFEDDRLDILCLCLQTSSLTSAPHEIVGKFRVENGNATVEKMICTCKAGLGEKCKHISAVLIHCSRLYHYSFLVPYQALQLDKYCPPYLILYFLFSGFVLFLCFRHNIAQFEKISSTDIKCIWSKKKESSVVNYKPEPISDFKCISYVPLDPPEKTEADAIRNFFKSYIPESAFAIHSNRLKRKDNSECQVVNKKPTFNYVTSIFEHAEMSKAMVVGNFCPFPLPQCCQKTYEKLIVCEDPITLCNETKVDLSRWKNERQFRITGSRCYALYTYHGNDWEMKSCKYFWPKQFSSIYTRYGNIYESEARDTYRRNLQRTVVECGMVVSKVNPFFSYSPDGIVFANNKPVKLLEIKCPYRGREVTAGALVEACDYLKIENDRLVLKKHHPYYGQVQFGMAVLNLPECDFVVYSSFDKSFLNIIVPFDHGFVNKLLGRLRSVYFEHMLHQICVNKF